MKVSELSNRLALNGLQLEIEDAVYYNIASSAIDSKGFGARPLTRLIVSEIENKIAELIVSNKLSSGDVIKISVIDSKISVNAPSLLLK